MITIHLNDEALVLEQPCSLQALLLQQGQAVLGSAIALNRQFIPRAQHATLILEDSDVIDIIQPMQGG